MKLLLTSAGIKNASIHNVLVDLLGKPIAECNALCIPTASYGHAMVSPVHKRYVQHRIAPGTLRPDMED
jgi:dipeptidase E